MSIKSRKGFYSVVCLFFCVLPRMALEDEEDEEEEEEVTIA